MPGKADGTVVRERARRIREIGQRLSLRFRASQRGTVHRALTIEDGTLAVTGNYLKVRIPQGHVRNEWVVLRLDQSDCAVGELADLPTCALPTTEVPPRAADQASASVPR
jgi:tRNA A37 methylthiotransferase MiaB